MKTSKSLDAGDIALPVDLWRGVYSRRLKELKDSTDKIQEKHKGALQSQGERYWPLPTVDLGPCFRQVNDARGTAPAGGALYQDHRRG